MKSSYVELVFVVVVLASALSSIECYPYFRNRIPNGFSVPNPCNRSTIWPGVGHQNMSGGGPRNPFGLDFKANGLVWNATICNQDSDGDGMSNGYELGDPYCKWVENATAIDKAVSHPGICEPLDKPDCMTKNSWLMNCHPTTTFDCPYVNETGVTFFDAKLPASPIPAQMTTYICYQFALPSDGIYDIIAFQPVLDNVPLVHHMLLFACDEQPVDHENNQTFYCGMAPSCISLIAAWAVGVAGQCLDHRMGFRIGPGGFRYGILQVHWNNHDLASGLVDSSGMRIYYTANLRQNRGQILIIGQDFLAIPPNTPNVVYTGGCSSNCTKQLPQPFYISISFLHMHLIGRSGNITLYRNGTYLQTIQDVLYYDFNQPLAANFPDLIEVRPGDELRLTCVYDSRSKNTTTYYGEATDDEMCYGFLAYFPASPQLAYCTKWKSIDVCNPYTFSYAYDKCDLTTFLQLVAVVPTVCARGCNSTACKVTMNGIYGTRCPSDQDALLFLPYFFNPRVLHNNDTTFDRCLKAIPPPKGGVPRIAFAFDIAVGFFIGWLAMYIAV